MQSRSFIEDAQMRVGYVSGGSFGLSGNGWTSREMAYISAKILIDISMKLGRTPGVGCHCRGTAVST